jgi:hypothetical protein
MRDAKRRKAVIVDQTSLWSNALQRLDPVGSAFMSDLPVIPGTILVVAMVLASENGAQ